MRRKEKFIINGALIGSGIAIGLDILFQWFEQKQKGNALTWENYNGWQTIKRAVLGSTIGAGVGFLYYEHKISEESKHPFNPDEFLQKVLSEENVRSNPAKFNFIKSKQEDIKLWLINKFGDRLVADPEDVGSFKKGTAIQSNFDLDIILPFKRVSYNTLEEMYNHVHDEVAEEFGTIAAVTKQTKAINVAFQDNEDVLSFDIVPGRERTNYLLEKDLNLFVRPNWYWQRGSTFKINVEHQSELPLKNAKAKKVIKLLKCYRDRNGLPLPSIIIEHCVLEALSYESYGIHPSESVNLLNCMELISKRIKNRLILDPTNSNNNLNNKISDYYKDYISAQLTSDILKVDENPRYLKEIFPL